MKTKLHSFLYFLLIPFFSQAQWTTTNLSLPRRDVAACTTGNSIFFAGGRPSGSVNDASLYKNRVDIYDLSSNSWSQIQLNIDRQFVFAVAVGNKVYFAGYTQVDAPDQNIVEVYDIIEKSWNTIKMPNIYGATSMTSSNDKVFLVNSKNVVIYNTTDDTWTQESLSENRILAYALECDGRVYFAGGGSYSSGTSATVDVYEISSGQWSTEQLSAGRNQIQGACLNGKPCFVGGGLGFEGFTKNIDIYDPATDTWSLLEMNAAKQGISVTASRTKLYIAGGADTKAYNDVEIFDGLTWEKTTDVLSNARFGVGSIAVDGRVYFAGGSSGLDFYTVVDILEEETSATFEKLLPRLEIMPNPVLDELTVELPSNNINLNLRLYSLSGSLIRTMPAQTSISLQGLPQGMYILRLEEKGIPLSLTKLLKL